MKNIIFLIALCTSFLANAERIKLPKNEQAMQAVSKLKIYKKEMKEIEKLSGGQVELIHITSKEKGIREDLGISEEHNFGMKHKFMFESADGSLYCDFAIYVIYRHTALPISVNEKYSEVTSKAYCEELN